MREDLIKKTEIYLRTYLQIVDDVSYRIDVLGENTPDVLEEERALKLINKALDYAAYCSDYKEYYEIIELYYFENWSIRKIADKFGVSSSTIINNRNKLLDEISKTLFFPEYCREILEMEA